MEPCCVLKEATWRAMGGGLGTGKPSKGEALVIRGSQAQSLTQGDTKVQERKREIQSNSELEGEDRGSPAGNEEALNASHSSRWDDKVNDSIIWLMRQGGSPVSPDVCVQHHGRALPGQGAEVHGNWQEWHGEAECGPKLRMILPEQRPKRKARGQGVWKWGGLYFQTI